MDSPPKKWDQHVQSYNYRASKCLTDPLKNGPEICCMLSPSLQVSGPQNWHKFSGKCLIPNSSWLICWSSRYRESLAIFGSYMSSSRGLHQPVFDLSPADQVGFKRFIRTQLSYQRLESTCLKSGSNQYEPTPSFVWGFQADIFRGWKYFTPDLSAHFWGWSYPYLGDEHPLGLSYWSCVMSG